MDEVTRCGRVKAIGEKSLTISFERKESCGSCALRNSCGIGGGEISYAEVPVSMPKDYQVGQEVTLAISIKNAAAAVFWSYGLPLILLLLVLTGALAAGTDDFTAGVAALLTPIAYYLLLFIFRRHFRPTIEIKIR